jgi:hypothetical protein
MARIVDNLKRQDPAYQLYTSDFLVRNIDMTNEQVGSFIRLLCFEHQNGHLTKATMLSICNGEDERVFSRFCIDENGLYYNEEMENEKFRRANVSRTKSENALKGWEKRKEEKGKDITPPKRIDPHISEYDDN